jgi:hypothetical protein
MTIRPESKHRQRLLVPYQQASVSANTSALLWGTTSAEYRSFRLTSVWLNPTGSLAASGTDYWTVAITDGTNTLASFSTAANALSTNTPVFLALQTNHDLPPAGTLELVLTTTGSPSALPAFRVVCDGEVL